MRARNATSGNGEARRAADPALIRQVRRIAIRTRRIVTESLAGSYHSAFRGRGMEFAEVREYRPGDDVRDIDWNVTSRSSRPERTPFVKVFTEERELSVLICADESGSTAFGTGLDLKREVMARVAAVVALSATMNRDRVGLLRFGEQPGLYVPPRRGPRHALRVVREVLTPPPGRRGTDVGAALEHLLRVQRKPAVVFVISDFRSSDFERPLKLAARRHDLLCVEVVDPAERELPPLGLVRVEDPESGRTRLVDLSSQALRERLAARAAARREALRALIRRAGAEHWPLVLPRVEEDPEQPAWERQLMRHFHARARRIPG